MEEERRLVEEITQRVELAASSTPSFAFLSQKTLDGGLVLVGIEDLKPATEH